MKVFVCTKCGKAKKKKVEGQTRMTGLEVYENLKAWVEASDSKIVVKPVRCLDECKKEPVILVRPEKKLFKRVTQEKLIQIKQDFSSIKIDEN